MWPWWQIAIFTIAAVFVITMFIAIALSSPPETIYRNPAVECETHGGVQQIIADRFGNAQNFFCVDGTQFSYSYTK